MQRHLSESCQQCTYNIQYAGCTCTYTHSVYLDVLLCNTEKLQTKKTVLIRVKNQHVTHELASTKAQHEKQAKSAFVINLQSYNSFVLRNFLARAFLLWRKYLFNKYCQSSYNRRGFQEGVERFVRIWGLKGKVADEVVVFCSWVVKLLLWVNNTNISL